MPSSRASDEADRKSWESRSISCRRNAIRLIVQQQAHREDVFHPAVDHASPAVHARILASAPRAEVELSRKARRLHHRSSTRASEMRPQRIGMRCKATQARLVMLRSIDQYA